MPRAQGDVLGDRHQQHRPTSAPRPLAPPRRRLSRGRTRHRAVGRPPAGGRQRVRATRTASTIPCWPGGQQQRLAIRTRRVRPASDLRSAPSSCKERQPHLPTRIVLVRVHRYQRPRVRLAAFPAALKSTRQVVAPRQSVEQANGQAVRPDHYLSAPSDRARPKPISAWAEVLIRLGRGQPDAEAGEIQSQRPALLAWRYRQGAARSVVEPSPLANPGRLLFRAERAWP